MRLRLYAGSSLRALREEGVVLTDLTAAEEGPLFDSFVWKLYPDPAKAPGRGSSKQAARAAGGQASTAELPPHKFQRGESVLISWRCSGVPAQQPQQRQLAGQGSWAESGRTQDGHSSGSGSGSEGEGAVAGQGEDGESKILSVEGTVLEVRRGYLTVTLSKVAAEVLEEVVDGEAGGTGEGGEKKVRWGHQKLRGAGHLTARRCSFGCLGRWASLDQCGDWAGSGEVYIEGGTQP